MTSTQTDGKRQGEAPPGAAGPGSDRAAARAAAAADWRRYRELQQESLRLGRRLGAFLSQEQATDADFQAWRRTQQLNLDQVRRLIRLTQARRPRLVQPAPGVIQRLARRLADRAKPDRPKNTSALTPPVVNEEPLQLAPVAMSTSGMQEAAGPGPAPIDRPGFCVCGRAYPKSVAAQPAQPEAPAQAEAQAKAQPEAAANEPLPAFALTGNTLVFNLTYRQTEIFRRVVGYPRRIPDLREFLVGAMVHSVYPPTREYLRKFWEHPEEQFEPGYRLGIPGADLYPNLPRASPT